MPSFLTKTFSSYFNRIFQIDQSGNSGVDSTIRAVQTGDGANTSISLSDDVLQVQPQNDDGRVFVVSDKGGSKIITVDTLSSTTASTATGRVLVGSSQVNTLTLFKEMGLYDFTPSLGYHHPLIANNMFTSASGDLMTVDTSMFSNGDDPAATLDLDVDGTANIAVACYWYLDNDITLDSVRYMTTGVGTLNFHLESYTLESHTNYGDLSAGLTCADAHSVTSDAGVRTGSLTLQSADIDQTKVVIGFVESSATNQISCSLNIKYHIR